MNSENISQSFRFHSFQHTILMMRHYPTMHHYSQTLQYYCWHMISAKNRICAKYKN